MENPLNLMKLREMIKNGISRIPKDASCNEAIIVIGDTGVGKSTIMAFLSGAEMTVRYDGLKPILDCLNHAIKIGHEKYSETSIPNKLVIENLAFYDCPGFKDNKGEEYEISNSFFVQRLLDIYPKVKIVIMIDESHISEARADKLPKLTKNLLKSFKTFEDIKEGVIMIINRAERDLGVLDYHREIKKMCDLKNDRGWLFEAEEQKFLKYLMDNNRIVLFKQPKKEDKNKKFVAGESELTIMRTIRSSSYVRSKHILNILSESAKLAIRDFIDEVTNKSNVKIEAICSEIVSSYTVRVSKAGRDVKGLIDIKEEVINLAEEIKSAQKEDIVKILQRELPEGKVQDFSEDFDAVMFFKNIYDKTATYFSNLVNKIYS
jgi:GTP-binding protein EngB required for normal cell division